MLDIINIEFYLIFEAILIASMDLRHTCDTGLDRQDLILIFFVLFDFSRLVRARSDKRHISDEDIPELWKFIDREFLDYFSDFCDAWIILDFIERSLS